MKKTVRGIKVLRSLLALGVSASRRCRQTNRRGGSLTSVALALQVIGLTTAGYATTIVTNDFNDGTTQGWSSPGTTTTNESNQLRFLNTADSGNGSMQVGVDSLSITDWTGATTISFDMEFTNIDGLASPSELVDHTFFVGNMSANLGWVLDLTGWNFAEPRFFSLNIEDAGFFSFNLAEYPNPESLLTNVTSVGFLFATPGIRVGESTIGSALMDNFLVTSAPVPEPSASGLALLGLLGLSLRRIRR